jgi:integrase
MKPQMSRMLTGSTRKKEVMQGKDPLAEKRVKNYPFTELAEQYREWAARQRGYHTSKKYFITNLQECFGRCHVKSITVRLVEEYQSKLLGQGKAPATVNRHVACLKHMLTKAVEWEMTSEQTVQRIRTVKQIPEQNARLRYLSVEECQTLLNTCGPHLKPIVITALNTGMRKEEILSLRWDRHVDLQHGFILLDKTKSGERREIPINDTLRHTLQGLVRRLDSPHVFTDGKGSRYGDVKKGFRAACQRAGIKDFTFHDLRHTFASHLVMAGVDLPTIKELLGHKTLTMTLRYAHLAPSHKVRAVSMLHESLSGSQSIQKVDNPIKNGLAEIG